MVNSHLPVTSEIAALIIKTISKQVARIKIKFDFFINASISCTQL